MLKQGFILTYSGFLLHFPTIFAEIVIFQYFRWLENGSHLHTALGILGEKSR